MPFGFHLSFVLPLEYQTMLLYCLINLLYFHFDKTSTSKKFDN